LSPVATTAQEGSFFHAGGPLASSKAPAATGRWAAHKTAASFSRPITLPAFVAALVMMAPP
jgi:hypothetical protein